MRIDLGLIVPINQDFFFKYGTIFETIKKAADNVRVFSDICKLNF